MDEFLSRYHFLKSRKFWALIGGIIGILSAAFQAPVFPVQEVITGIGALVIGYMTTTAWEDTARVKATAAPTTTIETPSQNVTVSTSDETTPPQPLAGGRMGM